MLAAQSTPAATPAPANPTPASRSPDWPFLLAIGLALLAGYIFGKRRRRRR